MSNRTMNICNFTINWVQLKQLLPYWHNAIQGANAKQYTHKQMHSQPDNQKYQFYTGKTVLAKVIQIQNNY